MEPISEAEADSYIPDLLAHLVKKDNPSRYFDVSDAVERMTHGVLPISVSPVGETLPMDSRETPKIPQKGLGTAVADLYTSVIRFANIQRRLFETIVRTAA